MTPRTYDEIERRLIDHYQRDFPLTPNPYAEMARALGVEESEVLAALARLQEDGTVSRVGAVVRPNAVGASTLAAVAVPPERLDEIADLVSAEPAVNHNYEREHRLNLWFVLTAPDRAGLDRAIGRIERAAGLAVIDLPLLEEYRIDLAFPPSWP
jgi:DNA-binding Lrp family transcriptional regulator